MKWLRRWRESRLANRKLREIFQEKELLEGTSLLRKHAGRCLILDKVVKDNEVIQLRFGILRHPRPYPFSRQFHEVVEYYRYHAHPERLEREGSVNVSRLEGGDGKPSGKFGF